MTRIHAFSHYASRSSDMKCVIRDERLIVNFVTYCHMKCHRLKLAHLK